MTTKRRLEAEVEAAASAAEAARTRRCQATEYLSNCTNDLEQARNRVSSLEKRIEVNEAKESLARDEVNWLERLECQARTRLEAADFHDPADSVRGDLSGRDQGPA